MALNRLKIEYATLQKNPPNPQIQIKPNMDNMLEWHYVLHNLPDDTPYHGGYYWGKLVFPSNYPFAPPSIYMLTESGRFTPNMRLCLSMSDYHPESWNPSWRAETILVGLLSFMTDPKDPQTAGGVTATRERRVELARISLQSNAKAEMFKTLFPELVEVSQKQTKDEASASVATKSPVDDKPPSPARKKVRVEEEVKAADEVVPAPKAKAKAAAKKKAEKTDTKPAAATEMINLSSDSEEEKETQPKAKAKRAKAKRKGTKETPSPDGDTEMPNQDQDGGAEEAKRGRKRGTAELEAPVAKAKGRAGGKKK
eukprot:GDKI01024254.1.p1 GENE.GDKI01024254.1~~GDKI01024254.1.p1  ORF type:complete len:337 (-),score=94.66 GDKI01024254.1:10-945(-)